MSSRVVVAPAAASTLSLPAVVGGVMVSLVLGSACATTPAATAQRGTVATNAANAAQQTPAKGTVGGAISADPSAPSEPIYFAFDSDALTPAGQKTLQAMATYLAQKPTAQVTVEGHCDDAGTAEYNLALGMRRAEAITAYLKGLGVAQGRLRSVSYGEERPADAGSDDDAKARNRRGQLALAE